MKQRARLIAQFPQPETFEVFNWRQVKLARHRFKKSGKTAVLCVGIVGLMLALDNVQCANGAQAELTLSQGWNLVSLPLEPTNNAITSVLAPIAGKFTAVWTYAGGRWYCYNPSVPGLNDLTNMVPGKGYWIHMRENAVLTVSGLPTLNAANAYEGQNLLPGWNLVGYSAGLTGNVADVLAPVAGNVDLAATVEDENWLVYRPGDPIGSTFRTLDPFRGFWVRVNAESSWTAPNYRAALVDAVTGKPVIDAVVTVDGIEAEAPTDAQGVFTVTGLPDKPVQLLTVTAKGYAPLTTNVCLGSSSGSAATTQLQQIPVAPLPVPFVCEVLVPQNNSVWLQP